jgi:hypothetical protein
MAASRSVKPFRSSGAVSHLLLASAWLLVLLVCAAVGYLELFSTFLPYDDEGLFMLSNRLFLEGHMPYTELSWLFGPVHLAWVQLVHGLLAVPLSHEAIRFLTLLQWLAVAMVSGLLVRTLTRSGVWGCAAVLLSFIYLRSIINEPGHPQSLIALALLAIPLCAGQRWEIASGLRWLLVGALSAVVTLVKPNAGLFALAAVAVALASQVTTGRWRAISLACAIAGSLLFPFALMLPFLNEPNCVRFAALSAMSAAAAAIAAFGVGGRGEAGNRPAVRHAVTGLVVTGLLALSYTASLGIWPQDIVTGLLRYVKAQAGFYHLFRDYSVIQVTLAGFSLMLAVAAGLNGRGIVGRTVPGVAAGVFVLAATYSVTIDDPAHAQAMLGWAMPWCWALLVSRPIGEVEPARLLLALIAAWSPLLAYPVPGSQLYFGCLPVLLAALVCAADLAGRLGRAVAAHWRASSVSGGLPGAASVLVLVLAAGLLLEQFGTARARYLNSELLALPGTGALRIEPVRVRHYRKLADAADRHDIAFTTFRFNSLFFWSSAGFPASGALAQFPLDFASLSEQERAAAGLLGADSALLIDRVDLREARDPGAATGWIDSHFQSVERVGPYVLLEHKK